MYKPLLVDLDITKKCNESCSYCSANASGVDYKDELSLDQLKLLFDEFEQMNILKVSVGGGEPFCRDDIWEVLSLLEAYSFSKFLNTNGILIDDDIAKRLKGYSLDKICVTLDGSYAEKHDYARGKGTFDKTIKGIGCLLRNGIPVTILYTLGSHNADDLINTIKLLEHIGIENMTVMMVCSTGRASSGDFTVNQKTWYPTFLELSEMKKNKELKLNLRIIPPNESEIMWTHYYPLKHYDRLDLLEVWGFDYKKDFVREISCKASKYACSISSNGDVFGCNLMSSIPELCGGNVKNLSFEDIWNNSSVFHILRNLETKDLTGKCKDCENEWCGGGCRSNAFNLTGGIYGSDITCFKEDDKCENH